MAGLIEAMGGREAFVARLDRLFAEGRYWHGNEPSHHIAYLYDHAGAPWRTQEEVRRVLASEYGLGPAGLRGNDDTGQMSAWYVFSAIGLYPVSPGSPHYEIGSPLFEEARVDVGGGPDVHRPGAGGVRREPLRPVGDPRRTAPRPAVDRPRGRGPGRDARAADGPAPQSRLGRAAGGCPAVALHAPLGRTGRQSGQRARCRRSAVVELRQEGRRELAHPAADPPIATDRTRSA